MEHPSLRVVANVVSLDLWRLAGEIEVDRQRVVSPPELATVVLKRFAEPPTSDSDALRAILPDAHRPEPRDVVFKPIGVLHTVFDISEKTFDAAEAMLRHDQALDLVMLHIGSLDNIYHAFWQYKFPESFPRDPPAREDAEDLGPVIDRYLEYLDRRIARIIELMPEPPNIIVVADHGQEADPDHPAWKGWHSRFGLFAAAGPDIAAREARVRVSYFDIAPLVLELMGFEPAADLGGDVSSILSRSRRIPATRAQ